MRNLDEFLVQIKDKNQFYKSYSSDFQSCPILTRQFVQEHQKDLISEHFYAGPLRRRKSSGSTGRPVEIFWGSKELTESNLALWRKRKAWYNIGSFDKQLSFTLSSNQTEGDKIWREINFRMASVNVSLIHEKEQWKDVLDAIQTWQPSWFYIQPSILIKLTGAYQDFGVAPPASIRYIECCGEMLPEFVRALAQKIFEVPVAGMYGSEEMNGIALQCPECGLYHILEDNVNVEVLKDGKVYPTGKGEAIITNLCNHVMPLIRYNQADIITLLDGDAAHCKLYPEGRSISKIEGRVLDIVRVEDNVEFNSFMLIEVIDKFNAFNNGAIKEYKYCFHSRAKKLELTVVLDKTKNPFSSLAAAKEAIIDTFKSIARPRLVKMIEFDVNFVDSIMRDEGKFRVCKVEE